MWLSEEGISNDFLWPPCKFRFTAHLILQKKIECSQCEYSRTVHLPRRKPPHRERLRQRRRLDGPLPARGLAPLGHRVPRRDHGPLRQAAVHRPLLGPLLRLESDTEKRDGAGRGRGAAAMQGPTERRESGELLDLKSRDGFNAVQGRSC